jgi:hypothetical protein
LASWSRISTGAVGYASLVTRLISCANSGKAFDGNGSWQDFLVQFEMISSVNRWDNDMKAYELATSLRGIAQGIVTDIEPVSQQVPLDMPA